MAQNCQSDHDKEQSWSHPIPDFNLYYKAPVFKAV